MIQWIAQCIVAVLLLGSLNRLSSVICTVSAIDTGQGKTFSYNLPGMDAALIYLCECFDLCATESSCTRHGVASYVRSPISCGSH